ncbi:hypothetical protein DPEC_G00335290 [Dallia pectoralis]|uniref:Uncharacterized protein n=1 Tax=Dallia pectoralis TaxID=75939 RepID=A0ACC2F6X1_DALPE|nr:hypothetical protein DPEC_G00335290 [Dallia pectoralis]
MSGEIKVKRVSTGKRSRDGLRSNLTPAKKKASDSAQQCPDSKGEMDLPRTMDHPLHGKFTEQYCSDTEDLFGDYDSIVADSSFLAKLDGMEQNTKPHDIDLATRNKCSLVSKDENPDFTSLKSLTSDCRKRSCDDSMTDSILDGLEDHSFVDIPSSQLAFQQDIFQTAEKNCCTDDDKTSTPMRHPEKSSSIGNRNNSRSAPKARQRMSDQLKIVMMGNAAAPSTVSRTAVQEAAIVKEEISVAMEAMKAVSVETTDLGPFFGLPTKVKELICKLKGIRDLYEWQNTCLNLDSVQQRRNLIYSLPTSGGKTLVAEILILKELLCRKRDALFILPYISLVQEKVRGLASFGVELDFMVEEYAGSKGRFPPVKRRGKRSLYIATIEKAHSLVNSLIEANRLDNVGLVVVDELHMLGDGSRGAIIEMTLAKVIYVSDSTQIIGMSATLGNVQDLQRFLKAENYTNDFRPIELKEYVKLNNSIYEVNPKEEECFRFARLLNFKYSSAMQKIDLDHIVALVTEVIPSQSCLVFCPTKKNCENVAAMICKYLTKDFILHKQAEKATLLGELRNSGNGSLCPVLKKTVPYGLAYHHSGLTSEERRLVEEAYSSGVLCLLTCTSTLAAGINLPARRVILRSPYVAADFLKRSQYKQMVGRAGRAGIDTHGESILIIQEKDKEMAKKLVSAPMEVCKSNLMHDNGKGALSLILSLIGLNITNSLKQVMDFMSGTLLSVQAKQLCLERSLLEVTQDCVELLKEKGLVTMSAEPQEGSLQVTKLGRASYKGSVDLTYCEVLYRDLSKGLECLMLNSFLHLVYLVTPYEMVSQVKPDWMVYFRQFTLLSDVEQRMCAAVGVPESFIARKAAGQNMKNVCQEVVCRLYLAVVLLSLLKETDLWSVADRFKLSRGFLQTLLSSSSAFCACVLHFTEELEEFWPFKALLTELTRRLTYCVQAELIPLMEVAGVMEGRAKQLYSAGYKTQAHLANADPNVLVKTVENLSKKQANQIVASAKMLLNEKADALQEEVDDLLMMPLDLPSFVGSTGPGADFDSVFLNVDLSRVFKRVDERFLSVAIDAGIVAEEKFMYLLTSPKLKTLARGLTPAFLRFGGTRQDFMTFKPPFQHLNTHQTNSVFDPDDICQRLELPPLLEQRLKQEWTLQEVLLQNEDLQRKYRSIKFTEYTVDLLYSFTNCSGLDLIFGLNELLRTADNSWNSSNARALLQYCESKQYNMSWELGNEPNSYEKKAGIRVDGDQLGRDFVKLRTILQESKLYHNTGLYGPDISQPRNHRRDLLEGFLETGAEVIDGCTWHHYYVNGRDTSLEDFLDPQVLNTLTQKTQEIMATVEQLAPGKRVWLGETSSAYGGGAQGLSDTFAAGFMWLDKLGLGANLGLDVVIRQVLIGSGTYHLVDNNLDPLPDYWLSLLYKRLVGSEVLLIKALSKNTERVRVYLHCTNKKSTSYRRGAVTLFALNLGNRLARITVPAALSNSSAEAFVLQSEQPGKDGLTSKSVKLNGEVLKMVDDTTLPLLRGAPLPAGEHLNLPGYSFAFYVLSEAQAPAC